MADVKRSKKKKGTKTETNMNGVKITANMDGGVMVGKLTTRHNNLSRDNSTKDQTS